MPQASAIIPSSTAISYSQSTATAVSVPSDIPDALDLWLDKLALLESNGREDIKILDVNGRYSYGCLQFQMRTFLQMDGKYNVLSDTEKANPGKSIYDCSLQKRIARAMLKDNPKYWRAWYTSVKIQKLGLPPASQVLADAK